jgi:hypothetical protein
VTPDPESLDRGVAAVGRCGADAAARGGAPGACGIAQANDGRGPLDVARTTRGPVVGANGR